MATVSQLNTASANAPDLNSYLPHILECIPAGIVALDNQGRIVIFNRTAERITGFMADRVLGKTFDGVFKPDYLQNPGNNFKDILGIEKTTDAKQF